METVSTTLMCGICPLCGGLALVADEPLRRSPQRQTVSLDCGRCGLEFTSPAEELLFQAVPLDWFSQGQA